MSKNKKQGQKLPLWVSQNFLTSHRTIIKLLGRTTIGIHDHVLEIGPGKGHITRLLVDKCRKVTAVEIDARLYDKLLEKFKGTENLHLYHQDFLQWRLPASGAYKVFANIPFCHTTAILRKLTESRNPPTEAWLVMEKSAAKRFMGKPRETLRSLLLKPLFDLDIAYYFQREDFHPKPGVDVVLIHLKKKTQPDISPAQWRHYERFVANALQGGGAGLGRMFSKRQLSRAFREATIHGFVFGEILYVQWLCLFRCYCKHVLRIRE
ncbi:23S rRNA (adenine-N6)-dimethyltransferase [Desulfitobacterium sp. LBE]|uniref:23S ribosomal RNA methyltransferase Erm n=1 Tax=Desulfitobacterium sp. LBE TaxID=884086 RepID=UPI00119C85D0|nr:23S ribosomal RNA methyltransferase Erm [Desulfitobacterium sp. LBE]TWH58321.1 23S rRNA (adenine-N6)-dimethyltransferase [Desulfitobacterium sp. LBE]